jgi:hypothetical protein
MRTSLRAAAEFKLLTDANAESIAASSVVETVSARLSRTAADACGATPNERHTTASNASASWGEPPERNGDGWMARAESASWARRLAMMNEYEDG